MKTRAPQTHSIIRNIVILLLALAPMAQAQDLPQDLIPISIDQALALNLGRLFRVANWPDYPPLPVGVLPEAAGVQVDAEGNATNLFYSASLSALFLDDREWAALQALLAAQGGDQQMSEDEDEENDLPPLDTTQLYLEITNVASGLAYLNLHNGTNQVYAVWSTPDLAAGWNVAAEVWPTNGDVMPFTLPTTLGADNLFVRAQDWTGVTENGNTVPDWWLWQYFGTVALSDTNLDSQGANTLLYDYTNNLDPNIITFTLSMTNRYVNQTTVPLQASVLTGTPSFYAVLLNDTNTAAANWLAYPGTNLTVNLGAADGTYNVSVGLRGLPACGTPSWQTVTAIRDTTALTLELTNLPALSGSRPFIDPAGYVSRSLSSLTWTVLDATGATNTGRGMVVAQDWSLSDRYHTTNWFQCVDLPLVLGTNWISIQAVDWAGTVAVTNFSYVFDTNGDTTAPALSFAWPQPGTQVSATNITLQAWVDDDTAVVELQYTDGHGMLQAADGLVVRGGTVWVPSVPLLAGTNTLSLLATDAAGNMSTNTFNLLQTNVDLTIFPVSDELLPYAYATVAGSVGDEAATVTLNGVTATNLGSGSWVAYNVPLQSGGIVTLQATAQLGNGATLQALLKQERGPIVFTQTYGYKLDYSLTDTPTTNSFEGHHTELQWTRQLGGTNTQADWWVDPDGGVVTSNLCVIVWPPDNGYLPSLTAQSTTSYYSNGTLIATYSNPLNATPAVQWMEESSSSGSWPDYFQAAWSQSSAREVRLFTGDVARRSHQGVFDLIASLNYETELDQQAIDWYLRDQGLAFKAFLMSPSPALPVPSQQINLGGQGCLGSDEHLWTLQPDGAEAVITPNTGCALSAFSAPALRGLTPSSRAASVAGQKPSQYKSKPHITANNNLLGANHVAPWAKFCVGQRINFSQQFTPPLPVEPQIWPIKWTLSGTYVNDGTNVIPGGTFPNSSTNFFVNPNLFTNQTTSAWWVSGASDPPKPESVTLVEGLTFPNGQYLLVDARGKFTMYQPQVASVPAVTNLGIIASLGVPLRMFLGFSIYWDLYVNLNTNLPGDLSYVQLLNVATSWDDHDSHSVSNLNSAGQFWLDKTYPYRAEGSGPFTNVAPQIDMTFGDRPNLSGPLPYSFASASYHFIAYTCFQPKSAGSIAVAFGHYNWGWDGMIDYTSLPVSLTVSNVVPPTFTLGSSTLPIWTNVWQGN